MSLKQKIMSVFKAAKVTQTDDTLGLSGAEFEYHGKRIWGTAWKPYGIMSNVPDGAIGIVWAQNGHDSNAIGIIDKPSARPLKGLAKGEFAIANYLTTSHVFLKENGDVDVLASDADVTITANNIVATLTGAATITIGGMTCVISSGGINVTGGDIIADGISLKTHVHSGVDVGIGNTGGPI